MSERPELNKKPDAAAFRCFYYLKQNSQIEFHTFLIREVY